MLDGLHDVGTYLCSFSQPLTGVWVLNEQGQPLGLIQRSQEERAIGIIVMKSVDCPVCIDTLTRISNMRFSIVQQAEVVALNKAEPVQNALLKERQHLNLTVLTHLNGDVLKRFGLGELSSTQIMPGLVFLDPCGHIDEIQVRRRPGQRDETYILERLKALQKRKCDVKT